MGRVHGDTHLLLLQGFVHTASSSLVFVLYRFFIRPSSPSSSSSSSPLSSSSLRRRLCLSYLLTLGITPLVWKDKTSDLKSFFSGSFLPQRLSLHEDSLSLSLSLSLCSSLGNRTLFRLFQKQRLCRTLFFRPSPSFSFYCSRLLEIVKKKWILLTLPTSSRTLPLTVRPTC